MRVMRSSIVVLSEACDAIKELCEVASLAMASSKHSDEDDFDRVPSAMAKQ